jgi:hypothetical protein
MISVWEGACGKARLKEIEEAGAPIHDYNDGNLRYFYAASCKPLATGSTVPVTW